MVINVVYPDVIRASDGICMCAEYGCVQCINSGVCPIHCLEYIDDWAAHGVSRVDVVLYLQTLEPSNVQLRIPIINWFLRVIG